MVSFMSSASLLAYNRKKPTAFRLSAAYLLFNFSLRGDEGGFKPAQMA